MGAFFQNSGTEPVNNIRIVLHSPDTSVVIDDSTAEIGSLNPGMGITIPNAFQLTIGNTRDGDCIKFDLIVRVDSERIYKPSLLIGTPILAVHYPEVRNKPSLPGQEKRINISLYNSGFGWGHSTWARLFSIDPHIRVLSPESLFYGEIPPKSLRQIPDTFLINISPSCPGSYLARLQLTIQCQDARFSDTLHLLIGEAGFSDDMERGPSLWQTGGSGNLWHISSRRANSGNASWYCGDEGTGRYNNNMNCWIQTLPFMVEENSYLKFWRWFKVPNYGVDGIYVIIIKGVSACTLDFIGTGGALGRSALPHDVKGEDKVIENDWCQEFYDLSFLAVGETIQVKIAFKSDNDGSVGEGFYIDDVEIRGAIPLPPVPVTEMIPLNDFKIRIYPNPSHQGLNISWDQKTTPFELKVYTANGSLIRTFSGNDKGNIFWDRRDERGRRVPSGLYFLILKLAGKMNQSVTKVILLQ